MNSFKTIASKGAIMLGMAALLSACQQNQEVAGPPLLNGNWVDSGGVYTATFDNGRFSSRANDTGNTLATGSYVAKSETEVRIDWQGQVSGQSNTAQCSRTPDRMDCVDKNGARFSLIRQGTAQG